MRRLLKLGSAIPVLVAALTAASPARAEEAAAADEMAAEAQGEVQAGDDGTGEQAGDEGPNILVTAQGREQQLSEVPLAVQAFTGEQLEETGYRDLCDVITLVPGASEGRGNAAGIRSYQIRGVSSFYGDSTIGYYLDEAAYVIPNRNYAPVARSFDIERVEVLRGPQGTLYGLGSMGGTIRFITADPDLNNLRARGAFGVSDTAEGGRMNWYGDLAVSVPIVPDALALRAVTSHEYRGGFAQSPTFPGDWDDDNYRAYRVKLLAQPSDSVTIRLGYHRSETEDDWGQNYATTDPASFPRSPIAGRNRQIYDMYTGFVSFDLGPAVIESSTGYVDRVDRSVGPIILGPPQAPAFRLDVLGISDSFVQEVRVVSQHDGPFEWVVGGIYQDSESLEDIRVIGGPPISVQSIYDSKSWAVFGEASIGLFNDTVRPLVGLRYFEDNRDFFTQNRPPGPVLPPPFVRDANFDSLNPRFNLAYQPNDDLTFYVNVARGFRSGTFNTAAAVAVSGGQVGFEVEPDNIWSYEAGGKFSLAGDRLYVEVIGYMFDWSNVQLNYTVAGGVQVIRNAGEVDGKGLELVLNWRPVEGLNLYASGNINETEFDSIINPPAFAATPSIAAGKQLASVPDNSWTLGATYTHPIGLGGADLFLNSQFTHIGRQGDPGDNLGRLGEPQDLLRARLGLQWENYGIFLFGENLLGENDPIQVSGSGRTRYYPRVIGVELSFDY
ncbi:MAG: TonB-dependent receptor [Allosphingosinicella sp.]